LPQFGKLAFLLRYALFQFPDTLGRAGVVHLGASLSGAWCRPSTGTSKHRLGRDVEDPGEPHERLVLGIRKAPASGDASAAVPDLL
jgi:hypothetical protein